MSLQKAIERLTNEADSISRRAKITPEEKVRHSTLLSQIKTLREKATASGDFNRADDFYEKEMRKRLVKAWSQLAVGYPVAEVRADQTSGQGTITGSDTTAGGAFVPLQFMYSDLQNALAQHDALFDENKVTLITTVNGNTLEMPLASDVSVKAVPVAEAASDSTYTNIAILGNAESNTFAYRGGKIAVTMEFGQDAEFHVKDIERLFAERIARGVGDDLVAGNGAGHITGIIPQLLALGVAAVTSNGSGSDDGGAGTGANSIGSADLRALYVSVNSAYRASPKAAWLMNDLTFLAIDSLRDKQARPLEIVKYDGNGQPRIFGKPVHISPSCPNIAASAQGVVLFGDFSRWITRQVPGKSYVQRYDEVPNLIEQGKVAFEMFARFGGQLLAADPDASPVNYIQMHS